jgi:hypothetical protein
VDLALAMVAQESSGEQDATSPKGAIGLFQLMPETAAELGVDPTDPIQNIDGGLRYFKQQLDAHKGNVQLALAAYNAGPGAVAEAGGIPDFPETQDYVARVLGRLRGGVAPPMQPAAPPPEQFTGGMLAPSTAASDPLLRIPSDARIIPGGGPGRLHMAIRRMVGAEPGESNLGATARHAVGAGRAMAKAMDPRTFEGRVNWAGAIGGLMTGGIATATTGVAVKAGVLPWIARILAAPAGAAIVAGAEATIEDLLGTAPEGMNPAWEGVKQGSYEAGGRLFMWPLRRVTIAAPTPKTSLAERVSITARETLKANVESTRAAGRSAVQAVQTATEGVQSTLRMLRAAETATSRERAAGAARGAIETVTGARGPDVARALERVTSQELQTAGRLAALTRQYDDLLAYPPSLLQAGGDVTAVMHGPAKRALDIAGKQVATAAAKGPDVTVAPVLAALKAMADRAIPAVLRRDITPPAGIGFLANVRAVSSNIGREGFDPTKLNAAIAQQLGITPEQLPPKLPELLGRILNLPEQISFADAHAIKMLLDETVNWDKRAAGHIARITKGVRTTLREVMRGFKPYDEATAVYQAVIPLYEKGIGEQILTLATQPDGAARIARSLLTQDPAQALTLRTLLLDQAAAGGDAALGRRAWDGVREAFTHEKIIAGGVEGLSARVKRLLTEHSEFARTLFHDESGKRVLSNLSRIGTAFDEVLAGRIEERVVGQEVVRATGKADVRVVREAATQATAAEQAVLDEFRASSAGKMLTREQVIADLVRGFGLGPGSIWGILSITRLALSANGDDLLRWAAYSDANTQRLLRGLYGELPNRVMAALVRDLVTVVGSDDDSDVTIPPPPPTTTP